MHRSIYCLLVILGLCLSAQVRAACQGEACVSMGKNLASVDSSQSALLSAVLSNLTNSSIDINTNELNVLAQGDVNLGALLQNVEALLGTDNTATALASEISLSQFYTAAANAANTAGDTQAAAALNSLSTEVAGVSGTFQLGDLITLRESENGYEGVNLNALELATGGIEVFNGNNAVTTAQPVAISGSVLGLGSVINSVTLAAQIVEPAAIVCGPAGSTFHSASIRVSLLIDLVDTSLDTSLLMAIPGIAGANASIGQVKLYVEVSRADGVIQSIDAINQALTINATPGIADLYLGEFPESVFLNKNVPLDPALLEFANIGSVSISQPLLGSTTVSLQAKSAARGEEPFSDTLIFNGPYPEIQSASTSADFAAQLIDSLMSNLALQLSPDSLGLLTAPVLTALQGTTENTLTPILSTVLTGVVDPLFETLGVGIGEVDVTVYAVRQTCKLSGLVYHDTNHNYNRDSGDTLCPETLYVKLVPAESPAGPALAVAAVESTSGKYTFSSAPAGNYSLILDTNNNLNDTAAAAPPGWLHTESDDGIQPLLVNATGAQGKNFGLFHGSTLSGAVFEDNGAGAANAHDGLFLADEAGLNGVSVKLINTATTALVGEAVTQGGGKYVFWLPYAVAASATLAVREINPSGYRSISANVGNTGGSYNLAQGQIAFVSQSGNRYENVNFGAVKSSAMQSDNQRTSVAGSSIFYPHTFIAGSEGQIVFSVNSASVSQDTWNSVLYKDSNCDGQLSSSEVIISASISVQANEKVCLILKTFVPLAAPVDARHTETLQASFTYSNTVITSEHQVTNITTVVSGEAPSLALLKQVAKETALPGETLTYTIRYENKGAGKVSELKIHDNTPAYTVFAAASCLVTSVGLSCAVSDQPNVGDSGSVTWTVTGVIEPGTSGIVQFSVVIQ